MISDVTVDADNMERAEQFYSAFLPSLGYSLEEYHGDLSYIPPTQPGQKQISPDFYLKAPFNGNPASAGNGSMLAFEAASQSQVREFHARLISALHTALTFTLDTSATLTETSLHCSLTIRTNPDATIRTWHCRHWSSLQHRLVWAHFRHSPRSL